MWTITPVYRSRAKLWVRPSAIEPRLFTGISSEFGRFDVSYKDNYAMTVEVLMKSETLVRSVITELELRDKKGNFLKVDDFLDPSFLRLIVQKKGLYIGNIVNSDTFEVTGYSSNPEEAKNIAEKAVNKFLDSHAAVLKREAEEAIRIIENRISDLVLRLSEAEDAVEKYKTQKVLFSASSQGTTLISQISSLETDLYSAQKNMAAAKNSLAAIKAAMGKHPEFWKTQTTIEASPKLTEARKQLLTLELSLAKAKTEMTAEHPDVKVLTNQIESAKKAISETVAKTFSSQVAERSSVYTNLISNYSSAEIDIVKETAKIKVLSDQIATAKESLQALSTQDKELTRLTTVATALRESYVTLLSNLETVKSARDINAEIAVVAQRPTISTNLKENLFFPKAGKAAPLALALILGGFLALAMAFLAEYTDDNIWTAEDIQSISGHKAIGVFPHISKGEMWHGENPSHLFDNRMHDLYVMARAARGRDLEKVILVTGPTKGEGKTAMAVSLASVSACLGKRTLLMDCDLRRPSLINKIFGMPDSCGLGDYLTGMLSLEETVGAVRSGEFDVMPAGMAPVAYPQRYLDSARFSEMLGALSDKYDTIILDSPAFECGSDAMILSPHAENIVIVLGQGMTPRERFKDLIESLDIAGINLLWIILNKVRNF